MTQRKMIRWMCLPLAICLLTPVGVKAQQAALTVDEIAQTWLVLNCGLSPTLVTEEVLATRAEELEPLFLEALREGPSPELTEEARRAAEGRFKARLRVLENSESLGLSLENRRRAEELGREEYLQRQLADLEIRYRAQAVAGLGIVGGPESARVLSELAQNEESPLQAAAQEALRKLETRRPG